MHEVRTMTINVKAKRFRPRTLPAASAWILFALSVGATFPVCAEESGQFFVVPTENPQYRGNELFRAFENYYSPRIRELRTRYNSP